jgi:hypothetical protein
VFAQCNLHCLCSVQPTKDADLERARRALCNISCGCREGWVGSELRDAAALGEDRGLAGVTERTWAMNVGDG